MKHLLTLATITVLASVHAHAQEKRPVFEPDSIAGNDLRQAFPFATAEVKVNSPDPPTSMLPPPPTQVINSSLAVARVMGQLNVSHVAWIEVDNVSGPGMPNRWVYYAHNHPSTSRHNGFTMPLQLAATTAASTQPIGDDVSIAVDRDNSVYVVWEAGTGINFARRTNGVWTYGTIRAGGARPKLAIYRGTSSDRIDLAYMANDMNPLQGVNEIRYQADAFAVAPGPEELVVTGVDGDAPVNLVRLVVKSDGAPAFAYARSMGVNAGRFVSHFIPGTGWINSQMPMASPTDYHDIYANGTDIHSVTRFPIMGVPMGGPPQAPLYYCRIAGGVPGSAEAVSQPVRDEEGKWPVLVVDSRNNVWVVTGDRVFGKVNGAWRAGCSLMADNHVDRRKDIGIGTDDTIFFVGVSLQYTEYSVGPPPGDVVIIPVGDLAFSRFHEPDLGDADELVGLPAGPAKVNAVNGNLYFTLPLFATDGRGLSVDFSLVYNSHQSQIGGRARGWRHNYMIRLIDNSSGGNGWEPVPGCSVDFGNGVRKRFEGSVNMWNGVAEDGHYSWASKGYDLITGAISGYELTTQGGYRYIFDANGMLVSMRDRKGGLNNVMTFGYTGRNLTSITDSVGRVTTLAYSGDLLSSVTDPSGHVYSLSYDADGNPTSVTMLTTPVSVAWTFSYTSGITRLRRITTPKNAGTSNYCEYYYWPDGRLESMTDPNAHSMTLTYGDGSATGAATWTTAVTDRRGKTSEYQWVYRACRIDKHTDALGYYLLRPISYFRMPTTHTDRRGNTTTYGYATYSNAPGNPPPWVLSNLESVRKPGWTADLWNQRNNWSQLVEVTDPQGNKTTHEYDLTGVNRTRTKHPIPAGMSVGPTEEWTYDSYGRVLTYRDPRGNVTLYEYGGAQGGDDSGTGLVTSILAPGNALRELYFYDVMGRVVEHRTPEGAVTLTQFNPLGWVTQKTLPAEDLGLTPVITYQHDANGNVTQSSGPRSGEVTINVYNALDRLTQTTNPLNGVATFACDFEGNMTRRDGPNGDWSEFDYDDVGRVSQERHYAHPSPTLVRSFTYDAEGNLLTQTLPALPGGGTVVTTHEYDNRDNRTKTIHADDSYDLMTYDYNDRLLTRVRKSASDLFHSGVKKTYDELGRLKTETRITDPIAMTGPIITNDYDDASNLVRITDPLGIEIRTNYDPANRPTYVYNGLDVAISLTSYDQDGRKREEWIQNPVADDNTLVRLHRYSYTPSGSVKTIESSWNGSAYTATQTYFYDLARNLTKKINEEGNVREWEYDLRNRNTREKVHVSNGVVREIVKGYDAAGNMTSLTDGRGKSYTLTYNKANKITSTTYPGAGASESWTYTAQGWAASYTDANGTATSFTYDANGRILTEAPSGFASIARSYDAGGNLLETEIGTIRTEFMYDSLSRLTGAAWHLSDTLWKAVSYEYDSGDRKTSMTDPEGVETTYAYDDADQLLTETRGSTAEATFTYDHGGRKKTLTFGNGAITTYSYDLKGRITQLVTKNSSNEVLSGIQYAYNNSDQCLSATHEHLDRRIDYLYNGAGELLAETHIDPDSDTRLYFAAYQYDAAGNRTLRRNPSGHSTYAYTDDNRLATENRYTPANATASSASASDTASGYSASEAIDGSASDGMDTTSAWASQDASGAHSLTASLSSAQDVAGARLWFPSTRLPQSFRVRVGSQYVGTDITTYAASGAAVVSPGVFKALGREVEFTFAAVSASSVTFEQSSGGGSGTSPNQAFLNELTVLTSSITSVVTYGYNTAGDQTQRQEGTTTETFTYDGQHRIATYQKVVNSQTTATWSYGYDAGGLRMYKLNVATGNATWFAYEKDDVVADYAKPASGSYSLETAYINSFEIDSKIGRLQGSAKAYYLNDRLNTNTRMLDASQSVVKSELTNAYGEVISSSGSATDRYGFSGREKDDESGLMHFRARAYDPRIGRFVQPDPLTWNRPREHYVYAANDPVSFRDPTGLITQDAAKAAKSNRDMEGHARRRGDWKTANMHASLASCQEELANARRTGNAKAEQRALRKEKLAQGQLKEHIDKTTADPSVRALSNRPPQGVQQVARLRDNQKLADGIKGGAVDAVVEVGFSLAAGPLYKVAAKGVKVLKGANRADDVADAVSDVARAVDDKLDNAAATTKSGTTKDGIVYKRTDPTTGKEYVGQAKSEERFATRQKEHDSKLGQEHDYEILGREEPGKKLDVLEETEIRKNGGLESEGGSLKNKRHQMSEKNYRKNGGTVDDPN